VPAEQLAIPAVAPVADAMTPVGSYRGLAIPSRDIPACVRMWRRGELRVERLLSSASPLADINRLLKNCRGYRAAAGRDTVTETRQRRSG
jgi:alcohol dehydrogenase